MAMETSFIKASQAFPVGLVKPVQLLGAAAIADELMAREQLRLDATRHQPLRHFATQHVDDHRAGDGRYRAGAPLQSFHFEDAISRRTMIVDDDIGYVDQLLSRGMRRGRTLAMLAGDDTDD